MTWLPSNGPASQAQRRATSHPIPQMLAPAKRTRQANITDAMPSLPEQGRDSPFVLLYSGSRSLVKVSSHQVQQEGAQRRRCDTIRALYAVPFQGGLKQAQFVLVASECAESGRLPADHERRHILRQLACAD